MLPYDADAIIISPLMLRRLLRHERRFRDYVDIFADARLR